MSQRCDHCQLWHRASVTERDGRKRKLAFGYCHAKGRPWPYWRTGPTDVVMVHETKGADCPAFKTRSAA